MTSSLSASEAPVPGGVGAQRPQEVDAAEVGPVDVGEVELRVRGLPEQEAREPLLPAGADDQVGIGLATGVEVLGDVLDVEHADQLVQRRPALGVLGQQRSEEHTSELQSRQYLVCRLLLEHKDIE